jgi:hypothetical protein
MASDGQLFGRLALALGVAADAPKTQALPRAAKGSCVYAPPRRRWRRLLNQWYACPHIRLRVPQ